MAAGHHRFDYRVRDGGLDAERARSGRALYVLLGLFLLTSVLLGQIMGDAWTVVFPAVSVALLGYALVQDLSPLGAQRVEIRAHQIRVHRWVGDQVAPLASLEPVWIGGDGEPLQLRSADGQVDVILPGLTDEEAIVILEALARSQSPAG